MGSASSEFQTSEHQEEHDGNIHLSNGAIITLIVMVILTFISLLGLLCLYFLCPRRRGAFSRSFRGSSISPQAQQQQQQQQHHHIHAELNFTSIAPAPKHGLGDDEIEQLPLLSFEELIAAQKSQSPDFSSSGCAVCLAEFREGDDNKIRFLPLCHHCFHPDCVDKWLRTSASCPLCRCNLSPARAELPEATGTLAAPPQEHSSILILTNRPLILPPNPGHS